MPCITCPNAKAFKEGDPEHQYANRKLLLKSDGSCQRGTQCPWKPKQAKPTPVCYTHNKIYVGCIGWHHVETPISMYLQEAQKKFSCRVIFEPFESECDSCKQGDLFNE